MGQTEVAVEQTLGDRLCPPLAKPPAWLSLGINLKVYMELCCAK